MQFSICQLLVLDDDYSYWLENNYNYFTVLLGELAVDSITFGLFNVSLMIDNIDTNDFMKHFDCTLLFNTLLLL